MKKLLLILLFVWLYIPHENFYLKEWYTTDKTGNICIGNYMITEMDGNYYVIVPDKDVKMVMKQIVDNWEAKCGK